MSRYIDADALIANCDIKVGDTTIGRRDYVMFHEIDSAPSIDIVRCRDCKYWDRDRAKRNKIQFKGYCDIHSGYCDRDKYCAWGERGRP